MVPGEPGPLSLSLSLSLPHPSAPLPSRRPSRGSSHPCVEDILSSSTHPCVVTHSPCCCAPDAVYRMVPSEPPSRSLAHPHTYRRHEHHATRLASVSKGSVRAHLTQLPSVADSAACASDTVYRMVPGEPCPLSLSLSLSLPLPSSPLLSTRPSPLERRSQLLTLRLCVRLSRVHSPAAHPHTLLRPSAPVPLTRPSRGSSCLCVDAVLSSSTDPATVSR